MGAVVGAAPAHADDAPSTSPGPLQSAEIAAADQARASGQPVPVEAATDAYSTLTAHPDGTFTKDVSASPQRVQKNGAWVGLDPTLHENSDGTYSTNATTAALTISGGGTTPLAAMDDSGKKLAFTWPTALPTPTVTGSTAVYPDVLPGVDLSLQANQQGGFTDTIVVKNAQAAQNPALTTLHLGTFSTGVTLTADDAGNLSAHDTDGTLVYHSPAPLMWDSSTSGADTPESTTTLSRAAQQPQVGPDLAAEGPPPGAQVAPVDVAVTPGDLQLTPSADLLTGSATTYPVYIDPSYTPTWVYDSQTKADYTYIQAGHATTSNWDSNDTYDSKGIGVGYQGYDSPIGIERSIYQFTIGTAIDTKLIHNAVLSLDETYVASFGCETHAVQAYSTAPHIGATTTWSNYSGATANLLDTQYIGGAYNSGCAGATPTAFDVTSAVSADGDGIITLELRGDESNRDAFKRFAKTAKLSYQYDTTPNVPDHVGSTPIPQNAPGQPNYGCNTTGDWGWISNGGSGGTVTLSGTISDPDSAAGQQVYGEFALWDADGTDLIVLGQPKDPTKGTLDSTADTNWQPSNSTALKHIPVSMLTDGHTYGYELRANDGITHSAVSYSCHFRYDATAPTGVSINGKGSGNGSCTDGGTVTAAGTPQLFTLTATDSGSGLDHFDWSAAAASDLADDGGSHLSPGQTLSFTPKGWGTYFLNISALDKAGNESGAVCYSFFVPDNPAATVTPGDIDGDGFRDFAAVPASGSYPSNPGLRYYPTNVTGAQGAIASNATTTSANGPNIDGTWVGALVAHRSTLQRSASGTKTDDLWALGTNDQLYIYGNNVNGSQISAHGNQYYSKDNRTSLPRPSCDAALTTCTQYAANWANVRQLIAPGDMNGDGVPDLVTEETGSLLWFFPGTPNGFQFGAPQLIGNGGWDGYTVIAPGNTANDNGVAHLWARNNLTGTISDYATSYAATTNKVSLPAPTQIGSGYTTANYPLIISVGDISGDSIPDIIATTTSGQLVDQLGTATASTTEFDGTAGYPAQLAGSGWTAIASIN